MQQNDFDHCRAILREGSRSFFAASLLLPTRVRQDISAVYAFCRQADDLIDEGRATSESIEQLEQRLDRIYGRLPAVDPVDRAMAGVVARHGIPEAIPSALVEGFAWEVQARRYHSLDDVEAYSARVAGTVGVMVTLVLGRRDPETVARAVDLGIAMQLTNIARDVGEDARRGRLYLPLDWLATAGVSAGDLLTDPRHSPELGEVVSWLLKRAETLYRSADSGIGRLPREARAGIKAASLIYSAIGDRIAARGHDSVSDRAYTSLGRKLVLALKALPAGWGPESVSPGSGVSASNAGQFLIDSLIGHPPQERVVARPIHLPARASHAERLEAALRVAVARLTGPGTPPKLSRAIHDAVFPSGHRLRPRLCYAVAQALGEDEPQLLDAAAVALEFLHCASLIQDDLPPFDDATERRNRPAVHVTHGEALAILASDALILGAMNVVGSVAHLKPERAGRLVAVLSAATGTPGGLVAGQGWESEDDVDLAEYHSAKTAALFEAATMAAAIACGREAEPWRAMGRHIGLAYQTADDLRDDAEPEQSDAVLGRPNVAHQMGRNESLTRLRLHGRRALENIPLRGSKGLEQLVGDLVRKFEAVSETPGLGRHLAGSGAD